MQSVPQGNINNARILELSESTGNHDLAVVRGLVAGGSGLLYAKDGWLVHVLLPRKESRPSLNTLILHKLQ
jgi:hypothetical protein